MVPFGCILLLVGLFSFIREGLAPRRPTLVIIKATEGGAKLIYALTNMGLLLSLNMDDIYLTLLKVTINAFVFVSGLVDLSVYLDLVPLWFTAGPASVMVFMWSLLLVLHAGPPGSLVGHMLALDAIMSCLAGMMILLVQLNSIPRSGGYKRVRSKVSMISTGFLVTLSGTWSLQCSLEASTDKDGAQLSDADIMWMTVMFIWHIISCAFIALAFILAPPSKSNHKYTPLIQNTRAKVTDPPVYTPVLPKAKQDKSRHAPHSVGWSTMLPVVTPRSEAHCDRTYSPVASSRRRMLFSDEGVTNSRLVTRVDCYDSPRTMINKAFSSPMMRPSLSSDRCPVTPPVRSSSLRRFTTPRFIPATKQHNLLTHL